MLSCGLVSGPGQGSRSHPHNDCLARGLTSELIRGLNDSDLTPINVWARENKCVCVISLRRSVHTSPPFHLLALFYFHTDTWEADVSDKKHLFIPPLRLSPPSPSVALSFRLGPNTLTWKLAEYSRYLSLRRGTKRPDSYYLAPCAPSLSPSPPRVARPRLKSITVPDSSFKVLNVSVVSLRSVISSPEEL